MKFSRIAFANIQKYASEILGYRNIEVNWMGDGIVEILNEDNSDKFTFMILSENGYVEGIYRYNVSIPAVEKGDGIYKESVSKFNKFISRL
jgi:hypothetical protein